MRSSALIKAALALSASMVLVTSVAAVVRHPAAAPRVSVPNATPPVPAPPTPPSATVDQAGETFTLRQVIDPHQNNLSAMTYLVPKSWRDSSTIVWDKNNDADPAAITLAAENPANAEAYFAYPRWAWYAIRPERPGYKVGQEFRGMRHGPPRSARETITSFAKATRGHLPQFQVLGTRETPELGKAQRIRFSDHDHGIAVKVSYLLDGQPVEEEFSAIAYLAELLEQHERRLVQVNWGLGFVRSFRAPAGTLDARRAAFTTIDESPKANPEWLARRDRFISGAVAEFNRGIRGTYNSIDAAKRQSAAISARTDAFIANVDRSLAASHPRAAAPAPAHEETEVRSSADKADDYIRGVDTVVDPNLGTSQHSTTEQYHWTDGNGHYRNSSDINYDPNQHEPGSWTLMQLAR